MITSKNLKMQLPEAKDYVKVKEHITDNLLLVDDEISKKASKTVLGRIIVGDNLTVDANGRMSGNPGYTHPVDPGNKHIPAGGTTGQFLKWLSSGVAQWVAIAWGDITGKPNAFPPEEHTHDYEPAFTKNNAFNKNYGTTEGTTLEGSKLAETLGIPYGGSLNTSTSKVVGTAYYDSTTKKTYKCTVTNSLNYADASKFEAISNADLLAKLQNLNIYAIPDYTKGVAITTGYKATQYGIIIATCRGGLRSGGAVFINGVKFGGLEFVDGSQGSQYNGTFTSPIVSPNQIFTTSGSLIGAKFYPFL